MWRRAFAGERLPNVSLLALADTDAKISFPFSDIDVLFAFADEKTEEQTREAVGRLFKGCGTLGCAPARVRERVEGNRPIRSR